MLQERYETHKFFEHIIKLTADIDPVLAHIDELLDDEELYCENKLSSFPHCIIYIRSKVQTAFYANAASLRVSHQKLDRCDKTVSAPSYPSHTARFLHNCIDTSV